MSVQAKQTEPEFIMSVFDQELFSFVDHTLLVGKQKKTKLMLAYKLLYNSGNIKEKLNSLYTEEITEKIDKQLQKILCSYPEHMFQDFYHIEEFNESLELIIRLEQPYPTYNDKVYKNMIGEETDFGRSICTISFERHLAQPQYFKFHLERLYNIIKRVIYRVKFNVALEYDNIGPLDYRILFRKYAQYVQFKHRLLTEENLQFPCVKWVCSGLSLALEPMAELFAKMIKLAPDADLQKLIGDICNDVPFISDTYSKLNKDSRTKAYQDTQQALEKLHGFFHNGNVQQLPTLIKS